MNATRRNKEKIFTIPHPLKAEFRNRKITLWMLRKSTGVVESQLSRYLNRIDPMPSHLENSLYKLIFILDGGSLEKWEEFHKITLEALRIMEERNKPEIISRPKEEIAEFLKVANLRAEEEQS